MTLEATTKKMAYPMWALLLTFLDLEFASLIYNTEIAWIAPADLSATKIPQKTRNKKCGQQISPFLSSVRLASE